jgi:hypothetical protein
MVLYVSPDQLLSPVVGRSSVNIGALDFLLDEERGGGP